MGNNNTAGWSGLILSGFLACFVGAQAAICQEGRIDAWLQTLKAIEPGGAGQQEAAAAWRPLAQLPADRIPVLLAALDEASTLGANWIRCAVDAIAERHMQNQQPLPAAALEAFVLDRSHNPRARRLAYEWLIRVDSTAEQRIIPRSLDDPSLEMRRDAVDRLAAEADRLAEAGKQDQAVVLWEKAFHAARDRDQVESLARRLQSTGQQVDLARHFGFVTRWKIIGPFDNTGEAGFDAVYPPERRFDPAATYQGKSGPVTWRDYTTDDKYGEVDLNQLLGEQKGVVAYAACEFFAPEAIDAEIRAFTENALKVWLNGQLVGEFPVYHSGSQMDQYVCPVRLNEGRNLILIKVCQNEQTQPWARYWRFHLRVCDATGGAILSAGGRRSAQGK